MTISHVNIPGTGSVILRTGKGMYQRKYVNLARATPATGKRKMFLSMELVNDASLSVLTSLQKNKLVGIYISVELHIETATCFSYLNIKHMKK